MTPQIRGFFITGIGTDVGKTVVAAIVAQALQACYWKPVQTGISSTHAEGDKETIQRFTSGVHVASEAYRLTQPISPHAAAAAEDLTIDLAEIIVRRPETARPLVVEGAGGIMVPLNARHSMLDMMQALNLPVLLTVRHYLGSINHSLLSLACLKQRGLNIRGMVVIGDAVTSSEEAIFNVFPDVPLLGHIPFHAPLDRDFIAAQAAQHARWIHASV